MAQFVVSDVSKHSTIAVHHGAHLRPLIASRISGDIVCAVIKRDTNQVQTTPTVLKSLCRNAAYSRSSNACSQKNRSIAIGSTPDQRGGLSLTTAYRR